MLDNLVGKSVKVLENIEVFTCGETVNIIDMVFDVVKDDDNGIYLSNNVCEIDFQEHEIGRIFEVIS